MNNPLQYTSRNFDSILADINSDPLLVDKPEWWKRIWAGIGDVISLGMNAQANNAYLGTAFTRAAVVQLCANIDYALSGRSTSSGTILFDAIRSASFPLTVTAVNLAAMTSGTLATSSKRFEALTGLAAVAAQTENFLPAAVNTTTGVITVTVDYPTGSVIRLTNAGGGLPTGLSTGTDYYVIRVGATSIKLTTTRALAFAGSTPIIPSTQGTGTHTIQNFSYAKTCYQQQTISSYVAGTSNGSTQWQEYQLRDIGILQSTIVVIINGVTWTRVDTFVNSLSTDTHYKLIYNTDGSAKLMFSNGTLGVIPGAFPIYVTYAVGGGTDSNVTVLNTISVYAGSDSNIGSATNSTTFTGGADEEDIETARRLAPILLKTRDRFVTAEDGEALVLAYGGVSLVTIIENFYGALSCKVCGIASGGGDVGGALRTTLRAYLIARSVLDSIDVRFEASTITSFAVTSSAKVKTGFTWSSDILPYFRLGWKLFLSEAGTEILNKYISNGIADTVTLINTVFTEAYTSADYIVITNLMNIMQGVGARNYGDYITASDAYALIQAGLSDRIDYLTITSTTPALPYTSAVTEISTYGVLTLAAI
jgi:hypothetical protein